jgi:peptidyl-prolyl cis-trans isomerase D
MNQSLIEKFRHKLSAKNITAIILFGAIIMVFVFFGMPSQQMGVGSVAQVNETLISVADFQSEEQRIQRIQEYYAQMFGQPASFSAERQKMIRRQAAESLVNQELLSQAAKKQGILATAPEVVDQIRQTPEFQENGQFQSETYFRLLEANRLTPSDFENRIRKQVAQNRVLQLFQVAATANKIETEKNHILQQTKWNVAFVKFDSEANAVDLAVSAAAVTSALTQPDFLKRAEDEFKANQNKYQQKEEVRAQHILIGFKAGDKLSEKVALDKVMALKARLPKEDFGVLAAQHSEDPGSKTKKGDLGYFARGSMVKEFEDVAFSSPVGVISEPVKTNYGYHLIKVSDHKKPTANDFAASQRKVAEHILRKEMMDAKVASIATALKNSDEALVNKEVQSLGLKWQETGEFDLSADVIPQLDGEGLSEAVFSLSEKNKLSQDIIRSAGQKYVLKLKEVKTVSLDTKPTNKEDSVKQRKAQELLEAWVDDFRKSSKVEINSQMMN